MNAPLRLEDAGLVYAGRAERVVAFRDASFALEAGEIAAVVGPSGAGKSSLLHVAGALEPPTQGAVWIDGARVDAANAARVRRASLGFVFQFHHLLADLTAQENVAAALALRGWGWRAARTEASSWLARLGLGGLDARLPEALSGGERQRVAIARALAPRPKLLIADEPTGSLDAQTAQAAFALLLESAKQEGAAVLAATHNHALAARADRVFALENGVLGYGEADAQALRGEGESA